MNDNEKQFEDFVSNIKFDDTPDPKHRDKLEQNILNALDKQDELESSPLMLKKSKARMKFQESFRVRTLANPLVRKIAFRLAEVAAIVALTLSINQLFHKPAPIARDDSAIISIYAREHQDVVARHASLSPAQPEPMQIRVNQDDILYYELLDDQPEYMRPGIIVRGPSYQTQINTSQIPAISNGHALTLSEAQEASDFDLVSPSWLLPCYRLDQIRIIEGRDALQLLYTNGINSISLFEQSLDGQHGLSHHDFREYAVYNNTEQEGVTILAWRDNALSYVLIGNTELSQLMDMAQSIKATK